MEKIIIVATSQNGVIGNKGKMPWHSREELKHFKNSTIGYPVIMGRKTFESIGKSLDKRLNIVLSKKRKISKEESLIFTSSLDRAFEICKEKKYEKIFVSGGESIFKVAIDICDKIILSEFKFETEGDRFFPTIDASWKLLEIEEKKDFVVKTYVKNDE